MNWRLLVLWLSVGAVCAQVPPIQWTESFSDAPQHWRAHGQTNLFAWDAAAQAIDVTWDSQRTNSYFYLPLGMTLTRADDFKLAFTIRLDRIAIGTSEGKPYTFQIAAGLLNLSNAVNPQFFRGAGIDAVHGARNLLELAYFPDSGFGATVAPTVATEANNIAFSGNYPLDLIPGGLYRFEMQFDSGSQTLRSSMWRNGERIPAEGLKPLKLSTTFADFRLDSLAIASYSDAGQSPQFAGSLQARGWIDDMELSVLHRVRGTISREAGNRTAIRFPTEFGWLYRIEASTDFERWELLASEIEGTGGEVVRSEPSAHSRQFFRVSARRRPE